MSGPHPSGPPPFFTAHINEEQTTQMESSEKLTPGESTLYSSLVMKLAYVAPDKVDIAEAVTCLTRHMKEPRSEHMIELWRLGRYLTKHKRCVLAYPRHMSDVLLQIHGFRLGRRTARKEKHDRCDCQTKQTHFVFANTRVIEWRSGVRRCDSRSVYKLVKSVIRSTTCGAET